MAHYLVYWKTYWQDVSSQSEITCDWFTSKRDFFDELRRGDSLWAAIPGDAEHPEEWRLLHRLIVDHLDPVPSDSEYGACRIVGNPDLSQLFDPSTQGDFTPLLAKLEFATGKSIEFKGRKIGQAIQSPRLLSATDADNLVKHATTLTQLDTNWAAPDLKSPTPTTGVAA